YEGKAQINVVARLDLPTRSDCINFNFSLYGKEEIRTNENMRENESLEISPSFVYQSYNNIYIKYSDGTKRLIRDVEDTGYFVGFSNDGKSIILTSSQYTKRRKGRFIMDLEGNNFREYDGSLPKGHPINRYNPK
ncbi:MAG: hypothetical protein AABX84_00835, partial [Nanoarchaeota archaeon]